MNDYIFTWLAGFGIGSALATMLMGWITSREFREWKSLCDASIEVAERYKKERDEVRRELWKTATALAARSCEERNARSGPARREAQENPAAAA